MKTNDYQHLIPFNYFLQQMNGFYADVTYSYDVHGGGYIKGISFDPVVLQWFNYDKMPDLLVEIINCTKLRIAEESEEWREYKYELSREPHETTIYDTDN